MPTRTLPRAILMLAIVCTLALLAPARAHAQKMDPQILQPQDFDSSHSELRPMIERYTADRGTLYHDYGRSASPAAMERFKQLYTDWLITLAKTDFDTLSEDGKVDYLLFQNHLNMNLHQLAIRQKQIEQMAPLVPFEKIVYDLDESRRRMEPVKSEQAAAALTQLVKEITKARIAAEAGLPANPKSAAAPSEPSATTASSAPVQPIHAEKTVARRAASSVARLRQTMKEWFNYYNGYDPQFTWWVGEPYKEADKALETYSTFLTEKLVGIKADDKITIIGDPVGRDALMAELADDMIPYTPEELIALAKNEMAWCTKEMIRASNEMGYGNDWHKALDHVKDMHVAPGEQPELIRKLAQEALEYIQAHDLVTVPELAKTGWTMEMMTPERQLVNPFFTGGDVMSVSFPTDTMTFDQRMMSMRGNNIPFSHATVFHELIPGHYLQQFMGERYHSYRGIFDTPFWIEGNAFYWETLLWDLGFDKTPEERVGALFWRMHRCARIIFSLSFHLGLMTPQECVDFLVKNVGHEVDNAAAEVRRSFDGSYSPLYQCAYMLGALQFRALHKELVDSGKMTNRQYHDAILHENGMPIEMLRVALTNQKVTKDFKTSWKFYGPIPATP
jgi:uncharacterized protein (DUF885 family)